MVRTKPFLDLRYELEKQGLDLMAGAKEIGVSYANFVEKMNLRSSWSLYEAYLLCQLTGHSLDEIPKLFPLDTVNQAEADRRKKNKRRK